MSSPELRLRRTAAYENPRPEVQDLVPLGARRILDLGCSSGALGAALKQRQGAEVTGVELDPDYAVDAARRLDRVVAGDLDQLEFDPSELGHFDCLIAADVLEHLRDPWAVLGGAAAGLLEPGGAAIISLPNVRYWETFVQLGLRGIWPVRDDGIFDRTHLRWFALSDALALIRGAGLDVVRVAPRYRLRPGVPSSERAGRRFARTPLAPLFTFQYVIVAVKPAR